MSRNYYGEINFHIVWHTKNSSPLLTPTVEAVAYRALRNRIVDTPGPLLRKPVFMRSAVSKRMCISPYRCRLR